MIRSIVRAWKRQIVPDSLDSRERLELAVLDHAACEYGSGDLGVVRITPWRVWLYMTLSDKVDYLFWGRNAVKTAISKCVADGSLAMMQTSTELTWSTLRTYVLRVDPESRYRITLMGLRRRDLFRPWGGRTWLVDPALGQRC